MHFQRDDSLRLEVSRGWAAMDRLAPAWDELAHAGTLSPTADSIWARCFCKAFCRNDEHVVLYSVYAGDRIVAVMPLKHCGRFLQSWESLIIGHHAPYWMFALDEDYPEATGLILDHLVKSSDKIIFRWLRSSGPLRSALLRAARSRSLVVWEKSAGGDTELTLLRSWEEFRRTLSKNLITDTERQIRRLQEQGDLRFETIEGGEELEKVLEECYRLEGLGWKGYSGTTIVSSERTIRFYTELAKTASQSGRFALYTLRLNNQLIAFDYCLRAQGHINGLKVGYHPQLARYSPGNVLRYHVLRREIEKSEIHTYHLGRPEPWKMRWCKRVEPLVHVQIYPRTVRGLVGYYAGPRLRDRLKRSPTLRRGVRYVRTLAENIQRKTKKSSNGK